MKNICIGILETGLPPAEFRQQYASYPDMFRDLLVACDTNLSFKYFAVLDNEIPTDVNECDAWLFTGSKYGVYEQHQWIPQLTQLIKTAYKQDIPMVGICFGHQLIAQALGGKVVKSDRGWSLGVAKYQLNYRPDWLLGAHSDFSIQAFHQDQVVELAENCQVVASSEFCPYAALDYNARAISFQGHPEFSAEYTQTLLINRRDLSLIPFDLSTQAIEAIESPIQRSLVATWICNFLRSKLQ